MRGIKEVKDFRKPATPATSTAAQIAGATILENVTLHAWTESNHQVALALDRLCGMLSDHQDEMAKLRRSLQG